MSFWNTSTGDNAAETGKSFEVEGGSLAPIPEGSTVLAMIEEVKWVQVKDSIEEYVNIKWDILDPKDYAGRKIFQKLWIDDLDPSEKDRDKQIKKKDRALRMFAAIDANAGGKLGRSENRPNNDDLYAALANKIMVVGLGVWKSKNAQGEDASGNWVRSISEKSAKVAAAPKSAAPTQSLKKEMADEIPF